MKFRIVTYNMHRAIGLDRRFRLDRVETILRGHNADIVLLQEVDNGVPRSRKLNLAGELAQSLGYPHYALGHNVKLREGHYGNATLSRFPIEYERNIDLTLEGRKARGCQHTSIKLANDAGECYPLEVFNLHLGLSARERQAQSGILGRSPEFADLDANTPCLVAGDFNDWRSLLRAFYVEGMGLACATDHETGQGPKAIKTYPSFSPRGGLDRIYYRGGLQLLNVQRSRYKVARIASDHLPVVADFKLMNGEQT